MELFKITLYIFLVLVLASLQSYQAMVLVDHPRNISTEITGNSSELSNVQALKSVNYQKDSVILDKFANQISPRQFHTDGKLSTHLENKNTSTLGDNNTFLSENSVSKTPTLESAIELENKEKHDNQIGSYNLTLSHLSGSPVPVTDSSYIENYSNRSRDYANKNNVNSLPEEEIFASSHERSNQDLSTQSHYNLTQQYNLSQTLKETLQNIQSLPRTPRESATKQQETSQKLNSENAIKRVVTSKNMVETSEEVDFVESTGLPTYCTPVTVTNLLRQSLSEINTKTTSEDSKDTNNKTITLPVASLKQQCKWIFSHNNEDSLSEILSKKITGADNSNNNIKENILANEATESTEHFQNEFYNYLNSSTIPNDRGSAHEIINNKLDAYHKKSNASSKGVVLTASMSSNDSSSNFQTKPQEHITKSRMEADGFGSKEFRRSLHNDSNAQMKKHVKNYKPKKGKKSKSEILLKEELKFPKETQKNNQSSIFNETEQKNLRMSQEQDILSISKNLSYVIDSKKNTRNLTQTGYNEGVHVHSVKIPNELKKNSNVDFSSERLPSHDSKTFVNQLNFPEDKSALTCIKECLRPYEGSSKYLAALDLLNNIFDNTSSAESDSSTGNSFYDNESFSLTPRQNVITTLSSALADTFQDSNGDSDMVNRQDRDTPHTPIGDTDISVKRREALNELNLEYLPLRDASFDMLFPDEAAKILETRPDMMPYTSPDSTYKFVDAPTLVDLSSEAYLIADDESKTLESEAPWNSDKTEDLRDGYGDSEKYVMLDCGLGNISQRWTSNCLEEEEKDFEAKKPRSADKKSPRSHLSDLTMSDNVTVGVSGVDDDFDLNVTRRHTYPHGSSTPNWQSSHQSYPFWYFPWYYYQNSWPSTGGYSTNMCPPCPTSCTDLTYPPRPSQCPPCPTSCTDLTYPPRPSQCPPCPTSCTDLTYPPRPSQCPPCPFLSCRPTPPPGAFRKPKPTTLTCTSNPCAHQCPDPSPLQMFLCRKCPSTCQNPAHYRTMETHACAFC